MTTTTKRLAIRRPGNRDRRARVVQAATDIFSMNEPVSADGCKRKRDTVDVLVAGSLEPHVAVMASGKPRTVFVIGHRCTGFAGPAYWSSDRNPTRFWNFCLGRCLKDGIGAVGLIRVEAIAAAGSFAPM